MDLKAKLDELQPRERRLLFLMAGTIAFLLLFVLVMEVVSAFQDQADEIDEYRAALVHLRKNQAEFLKNKQETEKLRTMLAEAPNSPATELSSIANEIGFDINVNPKETQSASAKQETDAVKQEIDLSIPSVDREQFVSFLAQIAELEQPLYVRKLTIRRTGRSGNTTDTPLNVSLTVSAFRLE